MQKTNKINVSTGGFSNQKAALTSEQFLEAGIKNIELSGGKYDENVIENIHKLSNKLCFGVHNYFPPPEESFVLNIASSNNYICKKSIDHVKKAILFCKKIKSSEYSIHAGFRLDPDVNELGKRVSAKKKLVSKKVCEERFYSSLSEIDAYAKESGIRIYIENNVVTKGNLKLFNENPFLLSDPEDISSFLEKCPNSINLLIDVAHLKVSSKTLKFDAGKTLKDFRQNIMAFHLSDNDGNADTNDPLTKESWFWEYLKSDADFYTI